MDSAVRETYALQAPPAPGESPDDSALKLSPRDLEFLGLLAEWCSNRQIAWERMQ
ncbi:DNA-binding NarL/FixJ family response regulator [Deinococcus humi]|uniref:DNA-binding NarL/FixJ family response regulator n=1 Tax=Deinococcus humi TaxID=662880 RepID=A0A7W8JUG0_9DEIO|nr:DNA-binding NarL/FixJ family response regulator [Deinococcus humi]